MRTMSCDSFCTLRKEVIQSGEGVWFEMTLVSGERAVVRLHRVNVVSGKSGPAIQVVRREGDKRMWEIPLSQIRGMRPVSDFDAEK